MSNTVIAGTREDTTSMSWASPGLSWVVGGPLDGTEKRTLEEFIASNWILVNRDFPHWLDEVDVQNCYPRVSRKHIEELRDSGHLGMAAQLEPFVLFSGKHVRVREFFDSGLGKRRWIIEFHKGSSFWDVRGRKEFSRGIDHDPRLANQKAMHMDEAVDSVSQALL